ncbi:RTA1 like protein-domain-containing protein, partial [Amylocarpus encephaloides]
PYSQSSTIPPLKAAKTSTSSNGWYAYKPREEASIIAAGLFGISAVFHLYQMLRSRTWFYTCMVIGSFMMTTGYTTRYISTKDPTSLPPYILQNILIVLPPSLYAATIYMIYGRIALFVHVPEASIIPPSLITRIFVLGDALSFCLQASGGGLMAIERFARRGAEDNAAWAMRAAVILRGVPSRFPCLLETHAEASGAEYAR